MCIAHVLEYIGILASLGMLFECGFCHLDGMLFIFSDHTFLKKEPAAFSHAVGSVMFVLNLVGNNLLCFLVKDMKLSHIKCNL
jgi:hypothetical protein